MDVCVESVRMKGIVPIVTTNADLWICANCNTIMNLDVHGHCDTCESEAVMRFEGPSVRLITDPVEELFARFEKYQS